MCGITLFTLAPIELAAQGGDRGESKATIGKANVTVEYGRPQLKGRDPLKMLQPGQVWRLGSNAPTTITSDADLEFGGTRVAKGKHILLARLHESGKWSLIVSTKSAFQYDDSAKVAEVPMELEQGKEAVEQLTIQVSARNGKGVIEVAWGTLRLTAPFAAAE